MIKLLYLIIKPSKLNNFNGALYIRPLLNRRTGETCRMVDKFKFKIRFQILVEHVLCVFQLMASENINVGNV